MKIRKATIKDLKKIQKLNYKLFQFEKEFSKSYDFDWPYSKDGTKYFKKRLTKDNGIVLVAQENNKIIGYICGYVTSLSYRKPAQIAEIDNMYILKNYRRAGIGTKLVKEFEKRAKEKGAKRIKVGAIYKNKLGKNFYLRHGFKIHSIKLEKDL